MKTRFSFVFGGWLDEYMDNNRLHRTDGPAREWQDGGFEYWNNGVRHRIDGPALKYINEEKTRYQYFIDGEELTPEQWIKHPKVISFRNEQKLKTKLGL